MVENSKAYDTGRQLGQLLRRGKESSDKTVAATKKVANAISTQSSVLTEFVKEVRDTARNDAGDRAESLALRKKEAKKSENEKNSEGGRFGKLITYFKKDAKESRTDFGKRLFGFFAKIALVGAAVVLFIKNWNNAIKPFFKGFFNKLKERLSPVFDSIKEQLKVYYEAFDKRFKEKFGTNFSKTLSGIKENLLEFTKFTKKIYNQLFGSNETTSNSDLVNPENKKKKALTPAEAGITDSGKAERFNEFMGDRSKLEERLRKKEIANDTAARTRIAFNTLRLAGPDTFLNSHKSIRKQLQKDQAYLQDVDLITQNRRKALSSFADSETESDQITQLKEGGYSDNNPYGFGSEIDKEMSRDKANLGFMKNVELMTRATGRNAMMTLDAFNSLIPYSEKITGTPNMFTDRSRYKTERGYDKGKMPQIFPTFTEGLFALSRHKRGFKSEGDLRRESGDPTLYRRERRTEDVLSRLVEVLDKFPTIYSRSDRDGGGVNIVSSNPQSSVQNMIFPEPIISQDPDRTYSD